jgi:ADP-heptose:LPS heptosyltransferase
MNASPSSRQHKLKVCLFDPPPLQALGRPKIMLLKMGERIGDFVTGLEAFRVIRQAFSEAEITLICLPSLVELAESTGLFDRVAGFSYVHDVMKEGRVPKMDADDQIAAFEGLMDGPYLFAADFRHDDSTRHWLDHVDAAYRAGFTGIIRKGLDITLPEMEWDVAPVLLNAQNLPVHTETRQTLLAHAVVQALVPRKSDAALFPVPAQVADSEAYRQFKAEPRMKVGVCLGAGSELRQWDTEYWLALACRMIQQRDAVVVFFGGGASDREATNALTAQLPPDGFIDLVDALPLSSVPSYMQWLDAYIGCDTGLTHLAAHLGVPTVNIYAGISNVSVWRARGPRVKTVYAEALCAPCHLRYRKDCANGHVCMKVILPDIVYACFEQLVAPGAGRDWAPKETQNNVA